MHSCVRSRAHSPNGNGNYGSVWLRTSDVCLSVFNYSYNFYLVPPTNAAFKERDIHSGDTFVFFLESRGDMETSDFSSQQCVQKVPKLSLLLFRTANLLQVAAGVNPQYCPLVTPSEKTFWSKPGSKLNRGLTGPLETFTCFSQFFQSSFLRTASSHILIQHW